MKLYLIIYKYNKNKYKKNKYKNNIYQYIK